MNKEALQCIELYFDKLEKGKTTTEKVADVLRYIADRLERNLKDENQLDLFEKKEEAFVFRNLG